MKQQLLIINTFTCAEVRNEHAKVIEELAQLLWEVLILVFNILKHCRIPNCTEKISR